MGKNVSDIKRLSVHINDKQIKNSLINLVDKGMWKESYFL